MQETYLASDIPQEFKVAENIDAGRQESVPVNALEFDVGVIFLEAEVQSFIKVDIWPLDSKHVFCVHVELTELKVFWEHLHF